MDNVNGVQKNDNVETRKRKKVDNCVEASLAMIYHKGAEVIECHCKQLIRGKHKCSKKISSGLFQIIDCSFEERKLDNSCSICIADSKKKEYSDQWYIGRDGYCRCAYCDENCEDEEDCDCPEKEYYLEQGDTVHSVPYYRVR